MSRKMLMPFALLAMGQVVFAAVPPSADSTLQRIAKSLSFLSAPADAMLDQAQESAMADSERILVTALRVTGARSYSEAELIAIAGFKPQSELTIPELRAMAATISGHYQSNGFLRARAYLPAQDIRDGLVTIAIADDVEIQAPVRPRTPVLPPAQFLVFVPTPIVTPVAPPPELHVPPVRPSRQGSN